MSVSPQSPLGARDDEKSALSSSESLRDRVRLAARRIEAQIIVQALQENRWNRRRTAQALNISYRSLMYKMKNGNLRKEGVGGPDEGE